MVNISTGLEEHSVEFAERFGRDSTNVGVGAGVAPFPAKHHRGVGVIAASAASFFLPSLGLTV